MGISEKKPNIFDDDFDPLVLELSDEEKHKMASGLESARDTIRKNDAAAKPDKKPAKVTVKKKAQGPSFFEKVIKFILTAVFGMTIDEYAARQQLKDLKRDMQAITPHIFNFRTNMVLPVLARQVFSLYKLCVVFKPAFEQIFRGDGTSSHLDLQLFFLHVASKNPKAQEIDIFSEASIARMVDEEKEHAVRKTMDREVKSFLSSFGEQEKKRIDRIYTELMNASDMLDFNFKQFLLYFNPHFDPSTELEPEFAEVPGETMIKQLKHLENTLLEINIRFLPIVFNTAREFFEIEIMPSMEPEHARALHSSMEEQSQSKYRNIVNLLTRLLQSNKLTILIRYLSRDFRYEAHILQRRSEFFADFSKNFISTMDSRITKMYAKKTEIENDTKVQQLFGLGAIPDVYVYSDVLNDSLKKQGIALFNNAKALNLTMMFFKEKYYSYMKRMLNKVLVDGDFKNPLTRRMISDEFYKMDDLYADCSSFLLLVDRKHEKGAMLENMINSYKGDLPSKKALSARVLTLNQELHAILSDVVDTAHNIQIALGQISADIKSKHPETIINLDTVAGGNHAKFMQDLASAHRDSELYCTLMGRFFEKL
jgi:hypothetical protein